MAHTRAGRKEGYSDFSSPGTTYFLGIGINDYQYWPKLRNAVNDVKSIAALLKEYY